MRLRALHRVILGGTAALGVIVAHGAAFVMAAPNPHVRQELLASTGHGYWAVAIAAGVGLFVAALAGVVWSGLRTPQPASAGNVFRRFASRLALLQVVGFVALEAVERVAVGGSLAELWTTPVVGLGIVAQVLVALVGAALVATLIRVVAAVASALRRVSARPARSLTAGATAGFVWAPAHLAVGGLTLRGPPPSE
jgi:hypothetical protein